MPVKLRLAVIEDDDAAGSAVKWLNRQEFCAVGCPTQVGHKRPGVTELYTAFDPAYLKDVSKVLDNLVRAVCVRMPVKGGSYCSEK
jgi:hypothetical protein